MWCEQCAADVATQIAADGKSLLCMSCGQPVRKVTTPSLHPETKSARDFLERWAREQEEARQAAAAQSDAAAEKKEAAPAPAESAAAAAAEARAEEESKNESESGARPEAPAAQEPPRKQKWRVDSQHSGPEGPLPPRNRGPRRPRRLERIEEAGPVEAVEPEPAPAAEAPQRPPRRRIDAEHAAVSAPHFDVRTGAPRKSFFPGRAETVWGQLLAYAGVGLLTVGTVLVLWGYFGELEQYASTGWLLSTAGQMLLLLGIVTLVAGGMQQTTHEVSQRIDNLGGRIIRIEECTDQILKGPHFQRSRKRSRQSARNRAGGEQDAA